MLLGLILLQAFVYSANATTYLWKSISLCYENERIKLNDDFTYELWMDDVLEFEGSWEFEDDEADAINLTIETDGISRVFHLRITEKGRGLADRGSSDRYVFIKKIEFNDTEYVKDGCN